LQPLDVALEPLAGNYRAFLVDQFGTLHDGAQLYPGALEAMRLMRRCGPVVLLSNSGKRAAPNAERLEAVGIPPDCYNVMLSSGELGWQKLRAWRAGTRVLLLSRGGDTSLLADLPLELVTDGADADLVVIAGSEADRLPMDYYVERLRPAASRGVGALCLNPDRTMVLGRNTAPGSGRIAELYESLGGRVSWIGKPHPEIYRAALAAVGNPEPATVLAVGDSVEHDIAGAKALGCAAALVRTGIAAVTDAKLAAEYRRWKVQPDFVLA
jgi:HAD superfamily hydrolase (TIGR01459 family)